MEELAVATPKHERRHWADARWLVLLLALTVPLRVWLLCHTEVPARDSIGFIRYALQFETQSWSKVVRANHQHPGYPLAVLAVSLPVRQFSHQPDTVRMQFSAQLASTVAAFLLIFPMFYLGKRLFNARVGFWAALIFQCLPVTGHILSDGLSEALFLLLTATTLCLAARALDGSAPGRFALCGTFCGLTYLTRPEGILLLACALAVLLLMQVRSDWRRSWRSLAWCTLALAGSALVVGAPYYVATGRFSTKPSVGLFLRPGETEARHTPPAEAPPPVLLAVVQSCDGLLPEKLWVGLRSLGAELVKGFHYVCWLPTLLGMCWYRRRAWQDPAMLLIVLLCGLHALVLWRLEVVVGYLSNRHIQLLVLGGVYPAAGLLVELPRWMLDRLRLTPPAGQPWRPARLALQPGLWSFVLLAALIGIGLPKTLQPLHVNRAGHHAAGLWLAQQMKPHDLIEDDHCWAHYYAGLVFQENRPQPPVPPNAGPRVRYCVVARARDRDVNLEKRYRTEQELKASGATPVMHFPQNRPLDRADVVIYAQPLPAATPAP